MKKHPESVANDSPYRIGATLPPTGGIARRRQPVQPIQPEPPHQSRRQKKRAARQQQQLQEPQKPHKKKHWLKRIFVTLLVLLIALAVGACVYGYSAWNRVDQAFEGSFWGLLRSQPMEQDQYGRTNILIFGTSEDDPGHGGAELADSIMVLSVDQHTNAATMISIPRDLWVQYNSDCSLGSAGKLNASYECAMDETNGDQRASSQRFMEQISTILGTNVQYYAKVNYALIRDVTNYLGGIDVTIDSTDSRGIYDVATGIKLSNGVHHLDGQQALDLARARGDFGGYGLASSNFDRERNQQAIVKAMLDKATSTGVLVNPVKVFQLIGAVGDNLLTNVPSSQLRTALQMGRGINTDTMETLSFDRYKPPLVTTGYRDGQSIVLPSAGLYEYSDIQAAVTEALSGSSTTGQ